MALWYQLVIFFWTSAQYYICELMKHYGVKQFPAGLVGVQ